MLLGTTCVGCGCAGAVVCATCEARLAPPPALPPPLHVDDCRALLAYDDASRPLLLALKNRDRREAVAWLATRLAATPAPGDVVTWAPTSAPRRARRGFDQAELLARALARRWARPARPLLRRLPGPPQSGRSAAARRQNPHFAAVGAAPAAVVVVDDIATTGATLTAAARTLRAAGAGRITAVVAARAPAAPGAPAASFARGA